MSVQCVAVASQKFTVPVVTGVVPDATVAVSVTRLSETTVVTELPPEVIVRIVEAGASTVNVGPITDVPPAVTTTLPVVAPAGTDV
jgi:hypothetical protein